MQTGAGALQSQRHPSTEAEVTRWSPSEPSMEAQKTPNRAEGIYQGKGMSPVGWNQRHLAMQADRNAGWSSRHPPMEAGADTGCSQKHPLKIEDRRSKRHPSTGTGTDWKPDAGGA